MYSLKVCEKKIKICWSIRRYFYDMHVGAHILLWSCEISKRLLFGITRTFELFLDVKGKPRLEYSILFMCPSFIDRNRENITLQKYREIIDCQNFVFYSRCYFTLFFRVTNYFFHARSTFKFMFSKTEN